MAADHWFITLGSNQAELQASEVFWNVFCSSYPFAVYCSFCAVVRFCVELVQGRVWPKASRSLLSVFSRTGLFSFEAQEELNPHLPWKHSEPVVEDLFNRDANCEKDESLHKEVKFRNRASFRADAPKGSSLSDASSSLSFPCMKFLADEANASSSSHPVSSPCVTGTSDPVRRHTATYNYLLFLRASQNTFAILTFASWLLVSPYWGLGPLTLGLVGERISLVEEVEPFSIILIMFLAYCLGGILLFMMDQVQNDMLSQGDDDGVCWQTEHTIWLTQLPRKDKLSGKPFKLTWEAIEKVEEVLKEELNKFVHTGQDDHRRAWLVSRNYRNTFGHIGTIDSFIPSSPQGLARDVHDSHGDYKVTYEDGIVVNQTIERDSAVVGRLPCGTLVQVIEVASHIVDFRVRAKIAKPEGWISLRALSGEHFASKVPPHYIEVAHIAPVVDSIHALEAALLTATERQETYRDLARSATWRCCRTHFERKQMGNEARAQALSKELEKSYKEVELSGSAFVTFKSKQRRDMMLEDQPSAWKAFWTCDYTQYTLWRFGEAPFASVQLRCERAVPASDLNWLNLHVFTQRRREFVCELTLALLMIFCFDPVSIINSLLPLRAGIVNMIVTPELVLVFINTLILPWVVRSMARFSRQLRLSADELVSMRISYRILVLSGLILPYLTLQSNKDLANLIGSRVSRLFMQGFGNVDWASDAEWSCFIFGFRDFSYRKIVFVLKYVLCATFFTNGNHLLDVTQTTIGCVARCLAVTQRERMEARQPLVYAWGFSYSWAVSIAVIGIFLAPITPFVLPCVASFFFVTHKVVRLNFWSGWYSAGPEMGMIYLPRALERMRNAIAIWILCVGLAAVTCCVNVIDDEHWQSCWVPKWQALSAAGGLVVFAVIIIISNYRSITALLDERSLKHSLTRHRGVGGESKAPVQDFTPREEGEAVMGRRWSMGVISPRARGRGAGLEPNEADVRKRAPYPWDARRVLAEARGRDRRVSKDMP